MEGLHFNLFHSADRALMAFSRDRAVGLDLEALLKASGLGLTGSLAACDVSVSADEPARLVAMPEAWPWSLEDLPPIPGYVSALAVAGRGHQRAQFHWSGGS